jgi:hypothetical protein
MTARLRALDDPAPARLNDGDKTACPVISSLRLRTRRSHFVIGVQICRRLHTDRMLRRS